MSILHKKILIIKKKELKNKSKRLTLKKKGGGRGTIMKEGEGHIGNFTS